MKLFEVRTFDIDPNEHVDDHLESLNEHTRQAAMRIFGTRKDTPRKPWISAKTWQIVRQIAPVRRHLPRVRKLYYSSPLLSFFYNWICAVRGDAANKWVAYGSALDAANAATRYLKLDAAVHSSIF